MMSNIVFVYYVVIMGLNGSQNIEVEHFKTFEQCEAYMHANHKKLKKVYHKEGEQRMTGSGCRRDIHAR